MTIIVNFLAGSGVGKSTIATDIFSRLKKQNVECELAYEYAKDLVWGRNFETLTNQIYVFAKQFIRIDRLVNKVDVVITDSPLLLSIMFKHHHLFKNDDLKNIFDKLVIGVFNAYDNLNYYIERSVPFNPKGRVEKTIDEAIENDRKIRNILINNNIFYKTMKNTEGDIQFVVKDILDTLERKRLIN